MEEKDHERIGRYLIFKRSGKYTIEFDIDSNPINSFKIVIGHGFKSGSVLSDQDLPSWVKYNITESSEKTIHVTYGDTMVFKKYAGRFLWGVSIMQIYYNFS